MSFIIDHALFSSKKYQPLNTHQPLVNDSSHPVSSSTNFLTAQYLFKQLNYFNQSGFQFLTRPQSNGAVSIFVSIPLRTIAKHFIMIKISVYTKLFMMKSHSHILNNEHRIVTLKSKHQKILLNKLVRKSQAQNNIKTMINLVNWQLKFAQPYFYFNNSLEESQTKGNCVLHDIINGMLKKHLSQCEVLFKKVTSLFSKDSFGQNNIHGDKDYSLTDQILRYIHRSTIQPVFDISLGSGKYQNVQKLENIQVTQIKMILNELVCNFTQFKPISLYLISKVPLNNILQVYTNQYFALSDREQQDLKQKMQHPSSTAKVPSQDQKFVCNLIQLCQPAKVKLQKLTKGGFSQIYKTNLSFWYIMTLNTDKTQKSSKFNQEQQKINQFKPPLRKLVNNKALAFKKQTNGKHRISHEQQIISKFKGISTIFLPQYYNLTQNQKHFQQYLIMEYFSSLTLNDYIEIHKLSISFLTKIHLALMIAQGLRVLKDCQVVHLDVKPSNCIVTKKMIVKLIDFGESYSKQLSHSASFKPGFTMPYGCPQIISNSQRINYEFTQKSDIYSLSVIIFQLLFERWPFSIPNKSIHEKYSNGSYMKAFYYVSEEEQNYGLKEIVNLLRSATMKGLDFREDRRPFCDWVVIILKDCLSYLVSLQTGGSGDTQNIQQFILHISLNININHLDQKII